MVEISGAHALALTSSNWVTRCGDPWVATYEYSFGPGSASALAVQLDGGLMIASPPCGAPDSAYEGIAARGSLRALIAPNAFHTSGIAGWRERFPNAHVFAPAQSAARVRKVSGVIDIQPLSAADGLLGDRVALIDIPHFKTGEALIKVRTERGLLWYVTDILLNLRRLPAHPLFALLFKLSGSAPGFKRNRIAPLFMAQDRAALRRWLGEQAAQDRPRWLIPAHGDVVDLGGTPTRLQELFR